MINFNFRSIYNNPSTAATFLVNSTLSGPLTATQGLLGSQAIDNCTDYYLKQLDKKREDNYFKSKPVKITLSSDFDTPQQLSPPPIIVTDQNVIKIAKEKFHTIEQEKAITSVETPLPIMKFHPYKNLISTTAQIGVSCLISGPTATVSGVMISGITRITTNAVKNTFQSYFFKKKSS